jgi:hypothetical protein
MLLEANETEKEEINKEQPVKLPLKYKRKVEKIQVCLFYHKYLVTVVFRKSNLNL